jgi:hypothetical protein
VRQVSSGRVYNFAIHIILGVHDSAIFGSISVQSNFMYLFEEIIFEVHVKSGIKFTVAHIFEQKRHDYIIFFFFFTFHTFLEYYRHALFNSHFS